jgi:DNA-binding response OmpR family regulator
VTETGGSRTRQSLLLVDDSEPIRDALSILLEDAGYEVFQAEDGATALWMAAEHRPDLVLLDLGLPDIPGLEVIERLRSDPRTAGIPIVTVTGRDEPADRKACLAAGCVDYLVKPVPTRELVRRVAELV